jgi:RHS repeat-associated protein
VYVGAYYEVTGGVVKKYYYAGGVRVAENNGGTLYFLLSDHLGSTAVTTDASGVRVTELRYYPYGDSERYNPGGQITTFRFTGQRWDPGTGLYFYNSRWYDPLIGRFIQADTIVPQPGNPQALNRYSYVLGNPLRYTDPTGHCATGDNDACDPVETRREHARIRIRTSPYYPEARLALANMIYGEQGGETTSFQVAAGYVAWNRAGYRLNNVVSVVAAANQFQGYQGPHIPIPEPTGRAKRAWDTIYNELVPDVFTRERLDPTGGAIFFANIVPEQEGTYADTLARLVQDKFLGEELTQSQALARAGYGVIRAPEGRSATGHSLVFNHLVSVVLENYRVANPLSSLNVSPGTQSPRGLGRHGEVQP